MTAPQLIVGCGYLGRRVARLWIERDQRVIALTRSAANAAAFQAEGVESRIGDVMHPETLSSLPEFNTLLYAVGYDRLSGFSQRDVYVDGLRNVLDAVAGGSGRIIFISSTSVYGQSSGEWVDETSPCQPERANGKVCLEAEGLLLARNPLAIVLRLAGIYGPGRLLRRLESLRAQEPVDGSPDAWLNLIHVDDAAQAVLAAEKQGRSGGTYLVCDDRPVTRSDYFSTLARAAGAPEPQFSGEPSSRTSPPGEGLNKRCSNRRLREELQVELQYPTIEDGLPAAVRETARPE